MGADILHAGKDLLFHGLTGAFFDFFFGQPAFCFRQRWMPFK